MDARAIAEELVLLRSMPALYGDPQYSVVVADRAASSADTKSIAEVSLELWRRSLTQALEGVLPRIRREVIAGLAQEAMRDPPMTPAELEAWRKRSAGCLLTSSEADRLWAIIDHLVATVAWLASEQGMVRG